jgi:hypothetical protein
VTHVRWKPEPDDHDYPAAEDYLGLVMSAADAASLVTALRKAATAPKKSKDLLRASRLATLDDNNVHVAKDLQKIHHDIELSPVLLVRGDARRGIPLIIADGYHRICAVHLVDEDAEIPCRVVDLD